jgi:hypothetical protein
VVPGVIPQYGERFFDIEALVFCDHALGLFDEYAAVERVMELFIEHL